MIYNHFIACDMCDTKINLRSQLGYFDIPFHIHCPRCQSSIDGKLSISGIGLTLENAHTISSEDSKFYSVELSAEFPTRKIIYKDIRDIELSPFLKNFQFYGEDEKAQRATQNAMRFANYSKNEWSNLKRYFELFWNNKSELLYSKLENEIVKFDWLPLSKISNDLDAAIALHQMLLTTTGITSVINIGVLTQYTEISNLLLNNQKHQDEILKFIDNMALDLNMIEKKAFELIDLFSKIYDQLIPVVALKNANCIQNVNREDYGIMTANFEELTNFYAKSYEWILDNINIVVALNNIVVRNDINKCANDKTYDFFSKESKGNKLKNTYIKEDEPFSKPTNSLNNRIRNAIQHFDSKIDYESQKITFTDRNKQEQLYLIDFAALCLENFYIIFYLLELVYNLRKVKYISLGIQLSDLPNIDKRSIKKEKKIGRNELCPCGSGKKYKCCCMS